MFNHRIAARRLGTLLLIVGASATSRCGTDFAQRFRRFFDQQLLFAEPGSECGPVDIGSLVPDCPVPGVCFTTACSGHNQCYAICGVSKKSCDHQFFQDLLDVCSAGYPLEDPRYTVCRYTALTYWLAVAELGDRAFVETQEGVCGPLDGGEDVAGACCAAGSPSVCEDDVSFIDCPATSVFLPDLSCTELDDLLGGCPSPVNDSCDQALPVCADQTPDADLGRCAGDETTDRGGASCSVTRQDCVNGLACLPVAGDINRCRVPIDNRLANTDGPAAGGACVTSGEDSFHADVWFQYIPSCSGRLTIRMCGELNYDAMLAVYGSHATGVSCICPDDNDALLACDDDYCAGGTTSGLTIESVIAGACYTIRVGGWTASSSDDVPDPEPARGVSELDISLFCDER